MSHRIFASQSNLAQAIVKMCAIDADINSARRHALDRKRACSFDWM
jgi:hypothetical protein